jgi:hypothetical protein
VGVESELGARESAAVDETGMNGAIRNDEVLWSGESGEDAQVCLIAGWK